MDLHGGNIYKFQREGKRDILDYSSNINPLGVPETLKEAIKNSFEVLERYPDINYVELRESIGRYNGVSKENIIVGNGATEVLFLYMKALSPKRALIVSPTFAEYERGLKNIDSEIEYFPLDEIREEGKNYFDLDIEKLKKEGAKFDLVVLCNPNNPTGNFIDVERIKDLNESLEKNGTRLFIDECFIEFMTNWQKKTSKILRNKNIFILRALTKYFALPGIRLGYGITYDMDIVKKIGDIREPWTVNAFADLAGKVILDDKEYMEKTDKWIVEERKNFVEELKKIEEVEVFETYSNFILLKLKTLTSEEFVKRMLDRGILVRDAKNFKFLNEKYVRIAIKDVEKNRNFINKIKNI